VAPLSIDEIKKTNKNRYQLHLWLGKKEYLLLQEISKEEDEPMSRILRRLIRQSLIPSKSANRQP
jgi:hypothetical protein